LKKSILSPTWCWQHFWVILKTVTVMLVTSLCDDADRFRYVGVLFNVLNRSPTSQSYHQHIQSPTSVTNIHVTNSNSGKLRARFRRTHSLNSNSLNEAEIEPFWNWDFGLICFNFSTNSGYMTRLYDQTIWPVFSLNMTKNWSQSTFAIL